MDAKFTKVLDVILGPFPSLVTVIPQVAGDGATGGHHVWGWTVNRSQMKKCLEFRDFMFKVNFMLFKG